MSQNTPTPKQPDAATVRSVTVPWWKSDTFWALVVSVAAEVPMWIDALLQTPGIDDPRLRGFLTVVSRVAFCIGLWKARQAGVKASARVKEQLEAEISGRTLMP